MKLFRPAFLVPIGFTAVNALVWHWWPEQLSPSTEVTPETTIQTAASSPAAVAKATALVDAPQMLEKLPEPPALPAPEGILALRQDLRWQMAMPEAEFAEFRSWTFHYLNNPSPTGEDLAEGIAKADARRAEMLDLISKDPKRALGLAVPRGIRAKLPEPIVQRLEEPISGRGDLWVVAAVAMPGKELLIPPVARSVSMADGRELEAFTYGRRQDSPCKKDLAIQGIAIGGKMALSDLPGRVLEPDEMAAAKAALGKQPVCPTSGVATNEFGDEIALDFDATKAHFFCGPKHAEEILAEAAAREAAQLPTIAASGDGSVGGSSGEGDPRVAQSSYTEGNKKLLIIRVDFPDKAGQVVSDSTLTSLINNMSTQWANMSYGKLNFYKTGEGSAFTPTLRLPNNHASYTGFGTMLNAARAAADDAGFDYRDYQFDVVVTGDKPDVGFGGVAFVGGRGAWLANSQWNLGVGSHEVGHNFGLNHSGFWDSSDGNMIGAGDAVEYGNPFDHMGGASSSGDAHFGARQKNYLDWIPDSNVTKVTSNGTNTIRLNAFDLKVATGTRAIAVDRANTTNDYWLEYRQNYSDTNSRMRDGVVLNWGPVSISNAKPILLDWTPTSSSKDDCPLLIGRTFSDTDAQIHLTPTGRGTDSVTGVRWIDVQVNRGAFTGNLKPTVNIIASKVNPAVNESVTFTATGTDPNGDPLAYFWEWGDGTYAANNSTTGSKSWGASGTQTVRCRVTDMKGQTATGQIMVQVGSSSTFFIQGLVRSTASGPLEGVRVTAGSKSDTTDSEGYFAITGLAAGNFTVGATKTGLTFEPDGFTNPVTVGPSKQDIDLIAPPGKPTFGTMKAGLLDQGSNTGPIILPVSDPDTLPENLTLTAVSSDPAIIPNASVTFGAVGAASPKVRTVQAAAAATVSGMVDITITATDAEGSSASYVWPVVVNAKPVLTPAVQNLTENAPASMDLSLMLTDDRDVPAATIRYEVSNARNGRAEMLGDGRSVRFTPATNFNGTASFAVQAWDRSLSSRTQLLLDFEPPDSTSDGKISDQSNYNRISAFEIGGSGGEYSYSTDVPPQLAPYSKASVNLTETGAGGARIRKTFAATDLNYNDADWAISCWVKRNASSTSDFVWHMGEGNGTDSTAQLSLYFPTNSTTPKLAKYSTAGLVKDIVGPALPNATWNHLAVSYDRTASNLGTLTLYVNGISAGSAADVAMDISQTFSLYFGGTEDNTANIDRWFDGRMDDIMVQSSLLTAAEAWAFASRGSAHQLGLTATGTVTLNVAGTNHPPQISPIPNVGRIENGPAFNVPVVLSDAESEGRTLSLAVSSSNQTLLPAANITMAAVPAAWSTSDIGTVSATGSMVEDHGTFILTGSGAGIGGTADEFRSLRQNFTGNAEISGRLVSLSFAGPNTRAGVMLRDASSTGAEYAYAFATPDGRIAYHVRTTAGQAATEVASVSGIPLPCWVKLNRTGSSFTAFYAADNAGTPSAWLPLGTAQTITFPTASNRTGLAVTSGVDGTLTTAVFDNLGGTALRGGERPLSMLPVAGQTGTTTITLTASDGVASATSQFLVTVGPNEPPLIAPLADLQAIEGLPLSPVQIDLSDLHSAPEDLSLTVTSNSSRVLPPNRITISGTGANRTLSFQPIPSEFGTITITLMASDGLLASSRSFNLTINPGDPAVFIRKGANWAYYDSTVNPTGWQNTTYNDSAWAVGPAKLGFGETDIVTAVTPTASRVTTYFRRSFQVANAATYPHLRLNLVRDDGCAVWLNGREIYRSNLPLTGTVNPSTLATTVGGTQEALDALDEVILSDIALQNGNNIIAVEVHQSSTTSSDLVFDLSLEGKSIGPVSTVAPGSFWSYLDTGVAPAATWKDPAFDDAAWLRGPAKFGFGDGNEVTAISGGPDAARFVTSWFRKEFSIADAGQIRQAAIRMVRDDGAVVYLNGQEIARSNMPQGEILATTLATAAAGGADESKFFVFPIDPTRILKGKNTLAVEIHQSSVTSSDLGFDLELLTIPTDSLPAPTVSLSPTQATIVWPQWAEGWLLYSSTNLQTWTRETATPVSVNGERRVILTRTPGMKYYRLALP